MVPSDIMDSSVVSVLSVLPYEAPRVEADHWALQCSYSLTPLSPERPLSESNHMARISVVPSVYTV